MYSTGQSASEAPLRFEETRGAILGYFGEKSLIKVKFHLRIQHPGKKNNEWDKRCRILRKVVTARKLSNL